MDGSQSNKIHNPDKKDGYCFNEPQVAKPHRARTAALLETTCANKPSDRIHH